MKLLRNNKKEVILKVSEEELKLLYEGLLDTKYEVGDDRVDYLIEQIQDFKLLDGVKDYE